LKAAIRGNECNLATMDLRIAFSTLAFTDRNLEQAISLGSSLGYAGVELRVIDGKLFDSSLSTADRARIKQSTTAARLPIVAVGSSVILTSDNPGPELHRMLELTNEWESPFIRVYGGHLSEDPETRRKQMESAAKVLEEAIPVAERFGVIMLVETHDGFSASSVAEELLVKVPSKSFGAIWDSLHPHRMGETPAEVYKNIGARTYHVHIKDGRRSAAHKGGWQLVPLGEGEVPVQEVLKQLVAGGYKGYLTVEWEKYWHPEIESAEVALPHELKVLQGYVENTQ
jgi:sugar phosphate isomerase/epimerase